MASSMWLGDRPGRMGSPYSRTGAARSKPFRLQFEVLEARIVLTGPSAITSHAAALVSSSPSPTSSQYAQWLNNLATVVLGTTLSPQFVSRTAAQLAQGLSPRLAIIKLLQTPDARIATSQFAYQFLLGRTEDPNAASSFVRQGNLGAVLLQVAASQEYFARAKGDARAYGAAVARDLLGVASLPKALQNRPVDTVAQRLAMLHALVRTPQFQRTWTDRLAGIALTQGTFPAKLLQVANREIAAPQGFRLVLARFLSSTQSQQDLARRSTTTASANLTVGTPGDSYYTINRQTLVPDPVTDPPAYNEAPTVSGTTGIPTASPWGNALVFPEVPYNTIMSGSAPQPQLNLPASLKGISSTLTFQTWFQAKSPGALLSESLSVGGVSMQAPLIYINTEGNLVAGLFDQSVLPINANQTVLSWAGSSTLSGGETKSGFAQVGAAGPIISQMSVVDNTWHHLAFVSTGATESLYLDGMLQGVVTPTTGLSYSFTPTVAGGLSVSAATGFLLGGATLPEPVIAPYPQINYPQGFIGTLDEVAVWDTALSQSQVQQAMTSPISNDPALSAGLIDYFNFNAPPSNGLYENQAPGQNGPAAPTPGANLVQVATTIPTDPFPNSQRLPGGRDWGLQIMTPLAAPTEPIDAGTAVTYKVGLYAGDQLGISVPDAFHGNLTVNVVTDVGATSTATFVGGSGTYIRASRTGTYNVTLTWAPETTGGASVNFALAPGSLNSLAEMLTSYQHTGPQNVVYQWAYSDPQLPGVNPSAGNQAGASAAASYFPLWTDPTYFPAPANMSSADWASALSNAYANLVAHSTSLSSGFANLIGASITAPTGSESVQADLDEAYQAAYGTKPPTPPNTGPSFPVQPTATPQQAVYEFLYNTNLMRQTAYSVLTGAGQSANPTTLPGWVQQFINTVNATSNVPANIANTIATGQAEQVQNVTVSFPNDAVPSAGQIIGEAAVWALGGALGAVFGLPEVGAPILGAILGGAGASIAGSFIGESGAPSNIQLTVPLGTVTTSIVNASHLDDLATNITDAVSQQWNNFLAALTNTKFIQAVLSNYGLMKALQDMSGAPLNAPALSPADAATSILTRASWQTMTPAVFHWTGTNPTAFPSGNGETTNLSGNEVSLNGPDGPQGITTGDFNNDGKLDMVVADYSSDELTLLLGKGDGTFQNGTIISLNGADGPQGVVAGEFDTNNNHNLDLVVADYSTDELSILLGNGDGTFSVARTISLNGPDGPKAIAVGDFNGDGKPDLAVSDYSSDELSILLGNGDGTFSSAQTVSLNGGHGPEGIAVADFNNDGKQDLVVADTSTDDLSLLLGNGDGTFQKAQKISLGGPDSPEGLVATDLNGDGNADIAVADNDSNYSRITILYGNGNGTFDAPTALELNTSYEPSALIAVPVKGSLFPSLVATYNYVVNSRHSSTTYSGISVFFSSGPGTYDPPIDYSTSGTTVFQGLAAGDFNGDGTPDLAVSNQTTDDLTLFTGSGVGNFATFLPGSNPVTLLGQMAALQGGNAVFVGPYDETSQITPNNYYSPPNYLADISLPYAPASGPLNITSPGYFLSDTSATLQESSNGYNYTQAGTMVSGWNLVDANGNPIALATLSQLFGTPVLDQTPGSNGFSGVNLTPIDTQQPYVGLNGGWYYAVAPATNAAGVSAPATWADAFFNWGYGQTGYSPRNLIPNFEPTSSNGTLSGTLTSGSNDFPSNFKYTVTYTAPTENPPTVGTPVNLQASFNRIGITADGSSFPKNPGIDGVGSAYSSPGLGSPISWAGLLFQPGALGANNAIAAAGQTIDLPTGSFRNLSFLGTAVNGAQTNQGFVVTYTDGTSKTFTQSLSDWGSSNGYSGEGVAVKTNYRNNTNGTINPATFDLYGYQFTLDSTKVVKSITLPNNGNVILLGMTLSS